MNNFEWNDRTIAQLRDLWASGLSTPKIALAMRTTKNAVVGKAHRLGLPGRPSPIKRPAAGEGNMPLVSRQVQKEAVKSLTAATFAVAQELSSIPTPIAVPISRVEARRFYNDKPCCWPIGNPRDVDFRFCSATTPPGRPYCEEHQARAVLKLKPQGQFA